MDPLLAYPRVEILAALSLIALAMILLPRRGRPVWLAGLVIALTGVSVQCSVLYPWIGRHKDWMVSASACPQDHRLKLLEANVQMTNEHADRLFDIIRAPTPT